jgi:hypothetical protein
MEMTTNEMLNYINKYKLEVENSYVSLDIITDSLLEESKFFLQKKIKENIEFVVINSKPEITQTLSKSKLQQMKSEMNCLIEDADYLMKKLFYSKQSFNHREYVALYNDKVEKRDNIRSNIRKDIEVCIRSVLGNSGKILLKYEYIDSESFKRKDQKKADTFIYMYELEFSRRLEGIIERYIDEFEDLYDFLYKIDCLQRGIEQQVAKNIWEQA